MHLFISKLLENHSCCRRNCPVYIIFVSHIFHCFVELFYLFLACLHSFRVTGSFSQCGFPFFSLYAVNLKKLKGPFYLLFFKGAYLSIAVIGIFFSHELHISHLAWKTQKCNSSLSTLNPSNNNNKSNNNNDFVKRTRK